MSKVLVPSGMEGCPPGMNNVASSLVVPGVVALLLFLVFTYLYEQSRQAYFRAWQIAWAAYTLHYALDAWNLLREPSWIIATVSWLLLVLMALCVFVSTRLMKERYQVRWYECALGAAGIALVYVSVREHFVGGVFRINQVAS